MIAAFCIAFAFRLWTVSVSRRHERHLMDEGAVEYGKANSNHLTLAHLIFYGAALLEGTLRHAHLDGISMLGIALYACGAVVLLAVMHLLGKQWTVRLIMSNRHVLVTHWLFRFFRHPNYFLALALELLGIAVCMHAWITLLLGLPLYAIPLARRIGEEERVMSSRFWDYGR